VGGKGHVVDEVDEVLLKRHDLVWTEAARVLGVEEEQEVLDG